MRSHAGYRIGTVEGTAELTVRAVGPDRVAPFAIGPGRADIGGYGGPSPRETGEASCVR
jgi:hypothetical protein